MKLKKNSVREYNFSDALLKQKADGVALCVLRDILLFVVRGVTNIVVEAFQNLIKSFDDIPTDEELQGDVSIATENKNVSAEALKAALRTIRTMAENKWGTSSAHYRAYVFEGMDSLNDEQLHRMAKRVIRVATKQLSDLAGEGLTQAMITQLNVLDTTFDDNIDLQLEAIRNRDIQKQERIDKGNLVYREMARFCNIGKDLFASTNEAKYNDYIIYDSPAGPTTPGELQFGSIHGNITDAVTGDPIAFVPITFDKIAETVDSDEDGDFEKLDLPVSCAKFTAELYGYEPYVGNITITANEDTTFDFMMTPVENPPVPEEE